MFYPVTADNPPVRLCGPESRENFMLPIILHLYQLAEVYTVILAWIVIPLAFIALFLFMHRHYAMFTPPEREKTRKEGNHG
jgi:hypothetical protein